MSELKSKIKEVAKAIVRVVLYLRLSDEDRNKLTKEQVSKSIKNQELMLREYAEKEGWQVVGVYSDDDWSGADSTRPQFNQMIQECEKRNVDVVLCKTQARFARDAELIEKYLHNKFHEWNVRFVTKVDNIDNTKRETKKTSQILGLTDQWYSEDTSINIRETLKSKRTNGELTASFAKYGLLKDPENKNHLIPDPISSIVVIRIYDEHTAGYSLNRIADGLNEDQIPSPYEYKKLNDSKYYNPLIKDLLDFPYIQKAGTYIISANYENKESEVLNNLITFNYLEMDDQLSFDKFKITLKRYTTNKMKIYYSEKKDLEINKFNEEDFILLKENDVIPNTATCIATLTKELDRTHIINYQLEVELKENIRQDKFYFKVKHYVDNIDVDIDFKTNIRKKLLWCAQTVKRILTDEVYIGNLIQFKTTTVNYKNKTLVKVPEEEQIRKNNTHVGYIDKTVFYTTRERLKDKARSCKNGSIHPLANKVFCSRCGKIFNKSGNNKESGFGYLCCKDRKTKWSNCDNRKSIREEDLHLFLIDKMNTILDRFYSEKDLNELNNKKVENDLFKNKLNALDKELENINKELESKCSYFQKLYEDRTSGLLPDKEFYILMNKYKEDTEKLEERKKIIDKEISSTNAKKDSLKDKKNILKKYRHIDKLTVELVNDFIDKVIIDNYDESTNTRDIKVIWNFTI